MFIGHFAMGLGAKKFAPRVSLGVLFLACQLADLVWPNLVLLGIETLRVEPGVTVMTPLDFTYYPWSHSLLATLAWAFVFAACYTALRRAGLRAAVVVGLLVLSHWVLDVLTHRPDMPVTLSDGGRIGLGLWNHPFLAVGVELMMFAFGAWMYADSTQALNRKGSAGFWALAVFLLLVYAASLLGPPPPSDRAVAWSAEAMWLLVAWGFWVDSNRAAKSAEDR